MPHVLIVNPSERKKGKTMAKAKRTAAQKRATAKMIAANKARRRASAAPKRKAVSHAKPKRRSASRAVAAPARSAPRRSKRRSHAITPPHVASRAGRQLRYRRKNPIGGFVSDMLIPSAVGGVGAIGLDVLLGVLPLPVAMKSGAMAPVVKIAGAIGLGMLAGMVAPKRIANQLAAGAITVTLYNVAKAGLVKVSGGKIPGLAEYISGDGVVIDAATGQAYQVGEYVGEDDMPQIGYPSAGQMVGELMPDGSVEGYETGVYR